MWGGKGLSFLFDCVSGLAFSLFILNPIPPRALQKALQPGREREPKARAISVSESEGGEPGNKTSPTSDSSLICSLLVASCCPLSHWLHVFPPWRVSCGERHLSPSLLPTSLPRSIESKPFVTPPCPPAPCPGLQTALGLSPEFICFCSPSSSLNSEVSTPSYGLLPAPLFRSGLSLSTLPA